MVTITHDLPDAPTEVERDLIQTRDAGERAANLMRSRMKQAARRALVRTWTIFSLLLFLGTVTAAGLGYYFWQHRTITHVTYERNCRWPINDKLEITGRRTYDFQQNELFGIRWNDAKGVTEQTRVDVVGKQMLVIGLTADDKWWAYPISMGERGIQPLKSASSYVFVVDGDKVGAAKYEEFCK